MRDIGQDGMKAKQYSPSQLPPRLHLLSKKRQIQRIQEIMEQVENNISLLPNKNLLFILQIKEAFDSLYTQGMDLTFKEVCIFYRKKPLKNIFMKRIYNYLSALAFLSKTKRNTPIDTMYLEKLHSLVERDFGKIAEELGHIREKQNWIGPKNCSIHEAFFLPPKAVDIPSLIDKFSEFIESDYDPILQLAIAFAQFLAIHPFMDGNGRVARLLIAGMALKKNLLCYPILFLSNYFLANRHLYIKKLFFLSKDKKWNDWVIFFLKGLEKSAMHLEKTTHQIYLLYLKSESALQEIETLRTRRKISFFLFKNPSFTLAQFKKSLGIKRSTCIQALEILKKEKMITTWDHQVFTFDKLIKIANKKSLT